MNKQECLDILDQKLDKVQEELEKEIVDEYQNLQSMLDEFGVAQEVSNGNKNIQ